MKVTDSTIGETLETVKTEISGLNNNDFGDKYTSLSGLVGARAVGNVKSEVKGSQTAIIVSGPRTNEEFNNGLVMSSTKQAAKRIPNRKKKLSGRKQVNGKHIAQLFASKKVQDELIHCEVRIVILINAPNMSFLVPVTATY